MIKLINYKKYASKEVFISKAMIHSMRREDDTTNNNIEYPYHCIGNSVRYCIPYNNDTKHLVGTTDEVPEYYRYWEE